MWDLIIAYPFTMKSQSIDICRFFFFFFFFFLTLDFKKGSKHLVVHTDEPVHDLNPYV